MTQFRKTALAACLIAGSAMPALAQMAAPEAPPAATQPDAPMPDAGIKKAPQVRTHHKVHHHLHAKAAVPAAPPPGARG